MSINGKLASEVLCLRSPAFKHYGRILGYQHKVVCNCKHIQTFENAPPGNCFSPFDEVLIYNPSFKDENEIYVEFKYFHFFQAYILHEKHFYSQACFGASRA